MANPTIYGDGTTTATGGANTITHYYDRAGIKAANAISVYGQFVDRKSMPQKMGKTFKISKWQHIYDLDQGDADFSAKGYLGRRDLSAITTNLAGTGMAGTLTEGAGAVNKVTPKKVTVEASLARYGFMVEYTDEVVLFSEDSVQVKYREELGYLMNQVQEDLVQNDMLSSAGIVINAGGGTVPQIGLTVAADDTNDSLYKVSFDSIRSGVKSLVRNRAQRNTEIVSGSTKIGTSPVNKAFYAIIGPEVKYDLETLTRSGGSAHEDWAYVPAYQYAAASNLAEGEVGSMHDVRFIESEGAMMEAGQGSAASSAAASDDYAGVLSTTTFADAAAVVAARGTAWDRVTDAETGALGTSALEYFDVFPVLFPTKGAFATVGLKGKGRVTFHAKTPMDVDLTNPHGTKGFFSANMFYAGLALQPEKILRINVLATA